MFTAKPSINIVIKAVIKNPGKSMLFYFRINYFKWCN